MAATPPSTPRRRRTLGKRLLASRGFNAALGLAARAYRTLHLGSALLRVDPALRELMATGQPAVFACWHQDFLFAVGWISKFNRRRPSRVLASGSRDGTLMESMARGVGFRGAVRGSSARGGIGALLELRRLAAEGQESLVVVCDGPRPPAFVVQPGAVDVAARSGLPLWLLRVTFSHAHVLERTWARFVLPWPLARTAVVADGPHYPPSGLTRAELDGWCRDLERRLHALAERGARLVGSAPPPAPSASAASSPPARPSA